jgi:hypothetical protein
LGCPTTLLVVTPSDRVARWAAKPIDLGRGRTTIEPLVIGPKQIPTTLTLEEARTRPDWLALTVMMHGHDDGSEDLNRMAMQVAREVVARNDRRSIVLADLIVDSVRKDVREMVQAAMDAETGWGKTLWFSEIGKTVADSWADGRRIGRKKGRAEGLAKGTAAGLAKGTAAGLAKGTAEGLVKALLMVLESREIGLSRAQRSKISRCRNPERLEQWLRRAMAATSASEIFA